MNTTQSKYAADHERCQEFKRPGDHNPMASPNPPDGTYTAVCNTEIAVFNAILTLILKWTLLDSADPEGRKWQHHVKKDYYKFLEESDAKRPQESKRMAELVNGLGVSPPGDVEEMGAAALDEIRTALDDHEFTIKLVTSSNGKWQNVQYNT